MSTPTNAWQVLRHASGKSTQWYCNEAILPAAFKYLGTLHCSERDEPGHSYPHTKSLVGKNSQGEWKSKGSGEYTPELCGLIALTMLEGHNFSAVPTVDVFSTSSLRLRHLLLLRRRSM